MTRSSAARLAFLLVSALLWGCEGRDDQKVEFLVPVGVREVGTGRVEDRITATGTLRAPQTATVSTETAGTLELAPIAEGDRVHAGQLLGTVTGEDVALSARTEATERRYEAAKRDLAAKQRLSTEGLIPRAEVDLAEAAVAGYKLDYERSRLTEARTRVTSPIDGIVLKLARDAQGQPIARGQRVPAGFVVGQIGPVSRLVADVDLVGPDAARVRVGLGARVRPPGGDAAQALDAKVTRLAPQVDPQTRALRAEIVVDNTAGALRPGAFVEATIVLDERENVPVVPRVAVTERGGVPVIFVLNGQKVARREVTLGLGDDRTVEVVSGVRAGERVVVQGIETLADGTPVRVTGSR